jgi:hypothetical protein
MAMAGRGEDALELLDGLLEKRPDGDEGIAALRDEIDGIMATYVEEGEEETE